MSTGRRKELIHGVCHPGSRVGLYSRETVSLTNDEEYIVLPWGDARCEEWLTIPVEEMLDLEAMR